MLHHLLLLVLLAVLAVGTGAQQESSSTAPSVAPVLDWTGTERQQATCTRVMLKLYGERNSGTNFVTELLHTNFHDLGWKVLQGVADRTSRVSSKHSTEPWGANNGSMRLPSRKTELIRETADAFFERTFAVNLGWKHQLVSDSVLRAQVEAERNARHCYFFLAVNKDPYSWLVSMYAKPYHYTAAKGRGFTGTFAEFVSRPYIRAGDRELVDVTKTQFETPMEIYNEKHRAHLALTLPKLVLRYQDVLVDTPGTMQRVYDAVREAFPHAKVKGEFHPRALPISKAIKGKLTTPTFFSDKYVNAQTWKAKYAQHPEVLDFINANLDMHVVAQLGYHRLLPGDVKDFGLKSSSSTPLYYLE
jgi:hypothetical protein